MTKNKWFKFYPSDFLTGIHSLEQIEVTAYIIVICEMYDHEGECVRNDAEMARRCRMRKIHFTKALDGLIAKGKVSFYAGKLTNKRVANEIENRTKAALEKAQQRHGNGMATTRPRHEQRGKLNKINGNASDVRPYIEERIKNSTSSLDVGACLPREPLPVNEASKRAFEDLAKRQAQRSTKKPLLRSA